MRSPRAPRLVLRTSFACVWYPRPKAIIGRTLPHVHVPTFSLRLAICSRQGLVESAFDTRVSYVSHHALSVLLPRLDIGSFEGPNCVIVM